MKDAHHILHYRREWTLRPPAQKIRENHNLIPRIDRQAHVEIHRECPPVPLLGYHALQRTVKLWEPAGGTIKSLDSLCSAIDASASNSLSHPLERELAYLTIEALELQRPFLVDALKELTIFDRSYNL